MPKVGHYMAGGFYIGLHMPAMARHFPKACVSINRIRTRRMAISSRDWIMDSGAFTELNRHGEYRTSTASYASDINRWAVGGGLKCAVTQDYMCEPFVLGKTGLTVAEHQRLTISRYDAISSQVSSVHLMPVLQGYEPREYVSHVRQYGDRLTHGMWVGVGSVCKRNGSPDQVVRVLAAVKAERPDLKLHGFGLKATALGVPDAVRMLYSSDSMAWSFNARYAGRDANSLREASSFYEHITSLVERARA